MHNENSDKNINDCKPNKRMQLNTLTQPSALILIVKTNSSEG